MNQPDHARRWIIGCLVALTAFAAAVRIVGIGAELPQWREPDTAIVHYAAWCERPADAPTTDAAFQSTGYPFLFGALLRALPGPSNPVSAARDASLEEHLERAAVPYLRARWMIMLLSLFVVPATYGIARTWLDPGRSVLAAAFAATSAQALDLATQARPHGGLTGLSALALFAIVRIVRRGDIRAYAFAAVTSALALAALHSGCFVTPALALAHWIGWRRDRDAGRWWKFALVVLVCVVAFVLAYPFIVSGGIVRNETTRTLDFGGQAILLDTWNGRGFALILPALFGHDPVLSAAALVGLAVAVWSLFRRRNATWDRTGEALVLGFHAAITVGAFGMQEHLFPRFMLPLLPLLALLAACGVSFVAWLLFGRLNEGRVRSTAITTVFAASLAFPAAVCVHVSRIRAAVDTRTLAANWLREHAARVKGPVVDELFIAMPVREELASIEAVPSWTWTPWLRYQVECMPPDAIVEAWPLRHIWSPGMFADRIVDDGEAARFFDRIEARWIVVGVPTKAEGDQDAVRAFVRRRAGEPVAQFIADRRTFDDWDSTDVDRDFDFVNFFLARDRLGPTIEIYEWRR